MEYRNIDKSNWARGPWDDEPDKVSWTDEETGMACLIKRHPTGGHLCGYVGVPPEHPWHGRDYDDGVVYADVHGGLTYAADCEEGGDEGKTICHVPQPGEPDDVWWLGFDCAHAGDLSPGYGLVIHETYKDIDYVRSEILRLAKQLASVS
jgi:hypothetical protein